MFLNFAGELRIGLTNVNYPRILNVVGRFALVSGEVFLLSFVVCWLEKIVSLFFLLFLLESVTDFAIAGRFDR